MAAASSGRYLNQPIAITVKASDVDSEIAMSHVAKETISRTIGINETK